MSSSEEAKRAGAEGPKSTNVLSQRRSMPFSPVKMAVGGFLIASTIGYFTLYSKKKPEASAMDVAKVTAGVASNSDVHPRN